MTLTNPYDTPPKKETTDARTSRKVRDTHHAIITRADAVNLCHYSEEAYREEQAQETGTVFIEHSVSFLNDIQCVIYTKEGRKIVSFRGTQEGTDWITDLNTVSIKLSQVFPFITDAEDLYAHRGFTKSLKTIYQRIKDEIGESDYDLTGHSLGAALATIFGYVYALDTEGKTPKNFYTFGSPRVFLLTENYPTTRYDDILEMVRIQNDNDVITYYPQKGGYEAVAKHGGAGAVLGSVAGSALGGGIVAGALLGSVSGAGLGVASGGYTHVGTGLILFEDIDSVVYTHAGGEKLLKGRNYYLMPEGVDLMRDPLDVQSTLTRKISTMGLVETAFETVRRLYGAYTGFGSFLDEGRRDGVLARARNIFNTNVRGRMTDEIVRRVAQSRTRDAVLTRSHLVYHADRMQSLTGRIWAQPAQYLTGELLQRYQLMSDDLLLATEAWLGRVTFEDAGFEEPLTRQDLDIFSSVFTREVEGLLNEQLAGDSRIARQFFRMLGLSMTVEMGLVAYAGHDIYTKTVGHKLDNYKRRLMDLPEVIYEGFTNQDVFYADTHQYEKVAENVYVSGGRYYYLTHHADKTTLRPMLTHILGYILYSPEEEAEHLNKMICF